MRSIEELDQFFQHLSHDFQHSIPDGVQEVTLDTLSSLNLLATNKGAPQQKKEDPSHYFHVHDSGQMITLYNDRFIAWIVPEQQAEENATLVVIATEENNSLHAELAFETKGVYNSSRTLLRVLEGYLDEINENDNVIKHLNDATA